MGSPFASAVALPGSSALVQAAADRTTRSVCGVATCGSAEPSDVHREVTRMWFSVTVPVLSVQITVVEPSVSTALRRLTTAPRPANTWTFQPSF